MTFRTYLRVYYALLTAMFDDTSPRIAGTILRESDRDNTGPTARLAALEAAHPDYATRMIGSAEWAAVYREQGKLEQLDRKRETA